MSFEENYISNIPPVESTKKRERFNTLKSKFQNLIRLMVVGVSLTVPPDNDQNNLDGGFDLFTISSSEQVVNKKNKDSINPSNYFEDYNLELLGIDPVDILWEECQFRTKYVAEMRFEQRLSSGVNSHEVLKEFREQKESGKIESIPLVENNRMIGGIKSFYDITLQTQRIQRLIEDGRLVPPDNKIYIDRIFRRPGDIIGALERSVNFLSGRLGQRPSTLGQDMKDEDRIQYLSKYEKELIEEIEMSFSEE